MPECQYVLETRAANKQAGSCTEQACCRQASAKLPRSSPCWRPNASCPHTMLSDEQALEAASEHAMALQQRLKRPKRPHRYYSCMAYQSKQSTCSCQQPPLVSLRSSTMARTGAGGSKGPRRRHCSRSRSSHMRPVDAVAAYIKGSISSCQQVIGNGLYKLVAGVA